MVSRWASATAVSFTAEVSDKVYKAQINANNKAYDPNDAGARPLPLLLYDGTKRGKSNSFMSTSKENREKALAVLADPLPSVPGFKWNESQRKFIDGKQQLTENMQVVLGSGGAGKTLIVLATIMAAIAGGDYALVTSERNAVCDTLLDVITAKYPHVKPVRAYAKALTLGRLAAEQDAKKGKASPKKTFEMDVSEAALNALLLGNSLTAQKKRRGRSQYSVEAHVMRYVEDDTKYMCQFQDGTNPDGSAKDHPDHPNPIDMFAYIGQFLKEIEAHPLHKRLPVTAPASVAADADASSSKYTPAANDQSKTKTDSEKDDKAKADAD